MGDRDGPRDMGGRDGDNDRGPGLDTTLQDSDIESNWDQVQTSWLHSASSRAPNERMLPCEHYRGCGV